MLRTLARTLIFVGLGIAALTAIGAAWLWRTTTGAAYQSLDVALPILPSLVVFILPCSAALLALELRRSALAAGLAGIVMLSMTIIIAGWVTNRAPLFGYGFFVSTRAPTVWFPNITAVCCATTIASSALNTSLNLGFLNSIRALAERFGLRDVPVEVRPQILYNPEMRSPNFFLPGVIGIVLQIATTFTTAMALVRERERGTLEQLMVSPLSRWGRPTTTARTSRPSSRSRVPTAVRRTPRVWVSAWSAWCWRCSPPTGWPPRTGPTRSAPCSGRPVAEASPAGERSGSVPIVQAPVLAPAGRQ